MKISIRDRYGGTDFVDAENRRGGTVLVRRDGVVALWGLDADQPVARDRMVADVRDGLRVLDYGRQIVIVLGEET